MMRTLAMLLVAMFMAACGGESGQDGWNPGPQPGTGGTPPAGGNVGFGGGQDFGAFRDALQNGLIPAPESIDATGFFAEHFTSLPPPACPDRLCLHAMLSVAPDLVHGGTQTLLQIGVNTPLDPDSFPRPPLDLVVVVDRSGSMASEAKIAYARDGVKQLVEALGPSDSLTLIAFDDQVKLLYGPARVTDRAAVKAIVDGITPGGSTNIYGALELAFQKALGGPEENQRRVIFLTDGLPTAGITDPAQIAKMSASGSERHVQLTTIGVGRDAGLPLLRSLAEKGGGNFYFLEDPQAVAEVFAEELRFFVAPIAYDLELRFDAGDAYRVAALEGSSLWERSGNGGVLYRPSVYLASRTSDEPGETGGRRGGGAALLAELTPTGLSAYANHRVATAVIRYRLPGATELHAQQVEVSYADLPGKCGPSGYASHAPIAKNAIILNFYQAFHEATLIARTSRPGAATLLQGFQTRVERWLAGNDDEDLQDDLVILQQLVNVVRR